MNSRLTSVVYMPNDLDLFDWDQSAVASKVPRVAEVLVELRRVVVKTHEQMPAHRVHRVPDGVQGVFEWATQVPGTRGRKFRLRSYAVDGAGRPGPRHLIDVVPAGLSRSAGYRPAVATFGQ